jgi:CubicO group peptidase (beta-lactamase class C family)
VKLQRLASALLGIGAFAMANAGEGGPPAATATSLLDAELAAIVDNPRHALVSLSVLAIRDGEVVYHRQFGRRFIGETPAQDRSANAATMYRVASISKLVTTLGVLRLVEEGRLELDADVSNYLGYTLRNPSFPAVPITLRMLLSHTSSLRDDAGYHTFGADVDLRDVLLPGGRLHGRGVMWSKMHAPGTWFRYANLPWGVVASVMEKVTGERFDSLMKRLVIEPLGMSGGYEPATIPAERRGDIATLYRKASAGDVQVWLPRGPWIAQIDDYSREPPVSRVQDSYVPGSNGTLGSPQGGLRASAADLGRVMRMLMAGGEIDGKRFLRGSTVDTMLSRQWTGDGKNGERNYAGRPDVFNGWGLGNQHFHDVSGPAQGDRLVEGGGFTGNGHHGDAYGLTSLFAFDPKSRNGVVVLVGGTGFDPLTTPGAWSWAPRYEERVVTALWRRAIQGRRD